jgi:acetyltransferase-like isoleucine patch superfamily enzyme
MDIFGRKITLDSLPHYAAIFGLLCREEVSSVTTRLIARLWGVKVGRGTRFIGIPSFSRCRESQISVGPGCRLLSSPTSNRHGLSRPCMLSTLAPGSQISIGSETGLSGTVICAARGVYIGDRVLLGANTVVTDTDSHPIDFRDRHPEHFSRPRQRVNEGTRSKPVRIEDDVFVGMNTMILKGVTIGRGAVIGASSVVTTDIPPCSIAAGNPAIVIRRITEDNT